jgi:hypothetical protein
MNIFELFFGKPKPTKLISPIWKDEEGTTPTPTQKPTATPTPQQYQYGRMADTNKVNVDPSIKSAIEQAAKKYDVPKELLYDIAFSESTIGKNAGKNPESTSSGLYQFNDPTWQSVLKYAQMPNSSLKLPNQDKNDPVSQALATAYLIKFGQLGRWDASRDKWGQNYKPEELQGYYKQSPGSPYYND